ncbi:hypothetical protein [Helicobacter sp.]|nr:hypothetical protein [Helicobacter sp.]MDY5556143.1 hypothetical protein [Helicobacter sp.]
MRILIIISSLVLILCYSGCSTRGYANSSGATGSIQWSIDF